MPKKSLLRAILWGVCCLALGAGCVGDQSNTDQTRLAMPSVRGPRELLAMLRDRPAMWTYSLASGEFRKITPSDLPWQYAAAVYSRDDLPSDIQWDGADLQHPTALAEHRPSQPRRPAFIRLRRFYADGSKKGEEVSFEDSWASFVFESFNLNNVEAYGAMYERARNRQISRREWILGAAKLEFRAMVACKEFYLQRWKPWAFKVGAVTHDDSWDTEMPDDFDTFMLFFPEEAGGWPWDVWGGYFDQIISSPR
jgi:hypothetical protein